MLKGISELQKRMAAVQTELEAASFTGESAEGIVKVTITGKGELTRVVIDPMAMTEDPETLADLVVVASRKAHAAKEVVAKEKLATLTVGALPFGLKIPMSGLGV